VNRSASDYYPALVAAFRQQLAEGVSLNYARAASQSGVTSVTAKRVYHDGRPGTATHAPFPPIKAVIEREAQERAGETPNAHAPIVEAASPPPVVALAPSASALTPPRAPSVASEDAEAKAVGITRHAVEGLAAVATHLLSGLIPMAAAARRQLETAAKDGQADAKWVSTELERIASSLSKSSGALARLVEAQSVLSGRPSQRVAVTREDVTSPQMSPEDAARFSVALLERIKRLDDQDGGSSPIDVMPLPAAEEERTDEL
jgi:hypothetical protein